MTCYFFRSDVIAQIILTAIQRQAANGSNT
jgi:hypothetical protein